MSRRDAAQRLRIDLLRARAAADRLDLALALRDIDRSLQPLRRAGRVASTVAGTLAGAAFRVRDLRSSRGFAPFAALLGLSWLWRRFRRRRRQR